MNYEFHVGDYVETWDGKIGYIYYFRPNVLVFKTPDGGQHELYTDWTDWSGYPGNIFKRIGSYDFTKKEKKKIMRLSEDDSWLTFRNTNKANVNLCYIIKRINELVDAVNKLRNDYDEHIEAHRQTDR